MPGVDPGVWHELRFLAVSMLLGLGIAIGDDIRLIARNLCRHNVVMCVCEDTVYLISIGIATFLVVEEWNGGIIRWYFFAGVMLTVLCYKKIMQLHLVVVMSTCLNKTIDIVKKPIKWLVLALYRALKKLFRIIKTGLTVCIKLFKIRLCKHKKGEG